MYNSRVSTAGLKGLTYAIERDFEKQIVDNENKLRQTIRPES